MDIPDVSELMPRQLLELHANIEEQLRALKIMRSANNPTGDLAEYLFRMAFGWEASTNSQLGFDATDGDGKRYQIKGRRIAGFNKSRQLSALRNISEGHFDFLAGVLFGEDYGVMRAAIIPHAVIQQRASFQKHTNSHRFLLVEGIWEVPGVEHVTERLKAVWH